MSDKEAQAAAQAAENAPEQPDLAKLMESITALGDSIGGISSRLNEFEEAIKAPVVVEEPVDPEADPDLVPPADWKAARIEWRNEAEKRAEELFDAKMKKQADEASSKAEFERDLDAEFDRLADEAVKKGFLPAVSTDDFNDPGKAARRELFGYAAKLGSTNLLDVAENLKALHDSGQRYDPQKGTFVVDRAPNPGRFAPVGSSSSRTQGAQPGLDYKTLHGLSLSQLASRAMQE